MGDRWRLDVRGDATRDTGCRAVAPESRRDGEQARRDADDFDGLDMALQPEQNT